MSRFYRWEDAIQLKEIAMEIRDIRVEFGQPNAEVEEFLRLCSQRGSNIPGEPKLAKAFLDVILKNSNNKDV
jgi:hypothetical protein